MATVHSRGEKKLGFICINNYNNNNNNNNNNLFYNKYYLIIIILGCGLVILEFWDDYLFEIKNKYI